MENRILFSNTIAKIAIAREFVGGGLEATVSGWGRSEEESSPNRLRYVVKRTLTNEECRSRLTSAQATRITYGTICAFMGYVKGM